VSTRSPSLVVAGAPSAAARWLRRAFALIALVSAVAIGAHAQTQRRSAAPPTGHVNDRAGLLEPAQRETLEQLLRAEREGRDVELAILIERELGGVPIADYALRTAREWGLGDAETQRSALLLVALEERELRIEVGRGLEGELTDAVCALIVREHAVPHFRAGDPYQGLLAAVNAMRAAIEGELRPTESAPREERRRSFAPFVGLAIVLIAAAASRRRGGGGPRSGGRGGLRDPLVWALLSGLGNPRGGGGLGGGGFGRGGGFGGFGGGGGFSGGGATGRW